MNKALWLKNTAVKSENSKNESANGLNYPLKQIIKPGLQLGCRFPVLDIFMSFKPRFAMNKQNHQVSQLWFKCFSSPQIKDAQVI